MRATQIVAVGVFWLFSATVAQAQEVILSCSFTHNNGIGEQSRSNRPSDMTIAVKFNATAKTLSWKGATDSSFTAAQSLTLNDDQITFKEVGAMLPRDFRIDRITGTMAATYGIIVTDYYQCTRSSQRF